MKLVAKYTFVLVAALGLAIAALAYFHVQHDQRHFTEDMRIDHRVVGHVLQVLLAEDVQRAPQVIDLANEGGGTTRFEWVPGPDAHEQEQIEDHDFVSRFPVRVRGAVMGALIVRESMDDNDRQLHQELGYTFAMFGVIFVLCVLVSLALSRELARALAQIATESEARVHAVEQLRHAERLATVGRLAAGLAHELGTPLSIVGGHAQMIAGREVTGDHVVASASAIDREADRMGRIVRQLLDFARRKGPEGRACDASEVARRCLQLLGPMAEHNNVERLIDTPPQPLRALIDEDSLQHVITNLAVNAVQAMPAGGKLGVTLARAPAVSKDGGPPRDRVRLDVRDTGSGIAPDVLPNIFEPFFTTKQPGDGTGLGLAVVYGIVDDHGGWISVATGAQGTVFSVFLAEAR